MQLYDHHDLSVIAPITAFATTPFTAPKFCETINVAAVEHDVRRWL